MATVLGYFVFENAGDGCLLGKYSNWRLHSPLTECTKLIRMNDLQPGFAGSYRSTWIEGNQISGGVGQATLRIAPKANSQGIFTLEWSVDAVFHGEGMLYKDLLIGAYWNDEVHGPTIPLRPARN